MIRSAHFPKSERIVSEKLIDELFSGKNSQSKAAFPLRIVYKLRPLNETAALPTATMPTAALPDAAPSGKPVPPVQVMTSVSKRHFKHAVDRNRAKRQLREAYRLNKHLVTDHVPAGHQLSIAFIWLSDQPVATPVVVSKMKQLLKTIAHHCMSDQND